MQNKDKISNISWESDLYRSSVQHRKLLLILTFILGLSIIICLLWMQTTISENKIEPFVIEIDKRSGIATTVKPVDIQQYSADVAVLKSLIISYIRAREEYIYALYDKNYYNVKVLSSPVIYRQYDTEYGQNNPNSPYNTLGKFGGRNVKWKSIIFPQPNTAQIRISLETINANGSITKQIDKIILMSFEFKPEEKISENDRLINPLGFKVTMYKIEDENPNI